ncbi:MAG: CDP-alcohol phosphatidyltransferase family protein [Chromatiales bacterium]|nr:CDP-alcohol phosphatidyltransferase family protein [Chromatiales bacterium]
MANAITILRFIGTLPFFFALKWNEGILASLALVILSVLTCIDGQAARRCGQASDFGETLDREVDALFFLGLCCLLYAQSKLGFWVLLPGSLRYLFVLFVGLDGPPRGDW